MITTNLICDFLAVTQLHCIYARFQKGLAPVKWLYLDSAQLISAQLITTGVKHFKD